jgi:hypothetical protein
MKGSCCGVIFGCRDTGKPRRTSLSVVGNQSYNRTGHLLNKIQKYLPLRASLISACQIQAEGFRLITCCKLLPTEGKTLTLETEKRNHSLLFFNFLLSMDRNILCTEWCFCNCHWCRNDCSTSC